MTCKTWFCAIHAPAKTSFEKNWLFCVREYAEYGFDQQRLIWYVYCSDEGLTLETSAKHHIPQATGDKHTICACEAERTAVRRPSLNCRCGWHACNRCSQYEYALYVLKFRLSGLALVCSFCHSFLLVSKDLVSTKLRVKVLVERFNRYVLLLGGRYCCQAVGAGSRRETRG